MTNYNYESGASPLPEKTHALQAKIEQMVGTPEMMAQQLNDQIQMQIDEASCARKAVQTQPLVPGSLLAAFYTTRSHPSASDSSGAGNGSTVGLRAKTSGISQHEPQRRQRCNVPFVECADWSWSLLTTPPPGLSSLMECNATQFQVAVDSTSKLLDRFVTHCPHPSKPLSTTPSPVQGLPAVSNVAQSRSLVEVVADSGSGNRVGASTELVHFEQHQKPPQSHQQCDGYIARCIHQSPLQRTTPLPAQTMLAEFLEAKSRQIAAVAAGADGLSGVDTCAGAFRVFQARQDPMHHQRCDASAVATSDPAYIHTTLDFAIDSVDTVPAPGLTAVGVPPGLATPWSVQHSATPMTIGVEVGEFSPLSGATLDVAGAGEAGWAASAKCDSPSDWHLFNQEISETSTFASDRDPADTDESSECENATELGPFEMWGSMSVPQKEKPQLPLASLLPRNHLAQQW